MGSAGEIIILLCMLLGTILDIVCVAIPNWRKNDPEDTLRDSIVRHDGLWIKCQSFSSGNWDCDDYNRFFLGLPGDLQAARALSISSIFGSVVAIGILCFGMESLPCGGNASTTLKKRIRLIAGSLSILSGILIVGAVSWYANTLRIDHEMATNQKILNNSSSSVNRYIFGESIFLGWVGGTILFIAGLVALCTGCGGGDSYEDSHARYAYRAPGKSSGNSQEYI